MVRNPVLVAAVNAGKASALATRLLGRGGGTALPGLVAQVVYPGVLRALISQLPEGSLMVTGTNGKTTTSRMIGSILDAAGVEPLHNRSGSNLERGLVSTVVGAATSTGGLRRGLRAGLFEVDEAAMSGVLPSVRPKVLLFNNLFRDQLDRYGEIDAIYSKWRAALPKLSERSTLVLNADDPAIASLGDTPSLRAHTLTFGVDDPRYSLSTLPHAADSISCPRCNSRLQYSLILLGHLGHWSCPQCGLARPKLNVAAKEVKLWGTDSSDLLLHTPAGELRVTLKVPGLYNVYNGLAAVAATLAFGVSTAHIKEGLERFTAAFGRIERVVIPDSADEEPALSLPKGRRACPEPAEGTKDEASVADGSVWVGGKELLMALVKNPVGFNEVLRMLLPPEVEQSKSDPSPKHLLIIINDLTADGRDVSWLWDVDFELLALPNAVGQVYISGIRASDMAVRLKYAGLDSTLIKVESEIEEALDAALMSLPPGETLYVLPTYTAMLTFRKLLHKRGWVQSQFWED